MELLERSAQLNDLHRFLDQADRGHGQLVVIGAEAGAGKTSLVRAFGQGASQRARLLTGACDALSSPRALGPFLDIAHLDRGLDRLLTEIASRDRLYSAVLSYLAANDRPTLLIIEDAHWADDATLDLLRFLARRIGTTRCLTVVTYRDDDVGPDHPFTQVLGDLATEMYRLSLPLLSEPAVARLAAGSGVNPTALYVRTRGNPFFVTEVLAAGGQMPRTVRDAVLARVSRLPPAGRDVLRTAAVIGPAIDLTLFHRTLHPDMAGIEACLDHGMLLFDGEVLSFRHELAREAVLATVSPWRQRAVHAAILHSLRSAPDRYDPARLAHHAEGSGDQQAVLDHAIAAARRGTALGAHREAAAQYERALRFAAELPLAARAGLYEAHAHACYLTARIDQAISSRQAALGLWVDDENQQKIGENHCHLAILNWSAARIDEANRQIAAAIATLTTLPPGPELARAYGTKARLRTTLGDSAGAILWGERAIALADRFGATETLTSSLITVGVTRFVDGDDRGREEIERGLALALEAGDHEEVIRATYSLGVGHGEQFRFPRAAPYFRAAMAYATERNLDHGRLYATAWLAYCNLYLAEWEMAVEQAMSVLDAVDPPAIVAVTALHVRGLIAARRGEPAVMALLDQALELAEGSGGPARVGPIRAARAEAAWWRGDRQATIAEAAAASELMIGHQQWWCAGELAYWRWKAGDLTAPPVGIAAPYAWQIAGDWERAATAWDELDCPYEAARARTEGNDEAALRRAFVILSQLDAQPAMAAVRRRWRQLGLPGRPRGPNRATHDHPAGLTGRQAQVLSLLAAGQTNEAIAAHLYLSPRTVEHHVSTLLAKLHVTDRAAAVLEAQRRGLVDRAAP